MNDAGHQLNQKRNGAESQGGEFTGYSARDGATTALGAAFLSSTRQKIKINEAGLSTHLGLTTISIKQFHWTCHRSSQWSVVPDSQKMDKATWAT